MFVIKMNTLFHELSTYFARIITIIYSLTQFIEGLEFTSTCECDWNMPICIENINLNYKKVNLFVRPTKTKTLISGGKKIARIL